MKAIEVISIPVTDQTRAKEFYQKLGFEILVDAPFGQGQQWVQLGFPGTAVSITLVNWFPEMPAGSVRGFVIKTDDLNADIKDLTAKGIELGTIDDTPWGKFLAIKDPDGNVMSLHAE
ncbi:glyoxalase [Mucilaginibacter sp. HC2]|uniref:VOC family protein n=1 Tax=Mucilaginibacter inviolabilis TaxID=2714892 RepID=UPI00140E3E8A|nr:VOC family protein [Mucilaginibacter inviolabilis]NHA04532.1 glyoxalase [Mucilaginibacter inviolabilis]